MQRLRFFDLRLSRLPSVVGNCQADVLGLANYVNGAQRRLLYAKEAGDEGWWGTWAEMAFTVSLPATPTSPTLPGPYLTVPREVARLEGVNLCERPLAIQNQFYEYLQFGNGRLPKTFNRCQGNRVTEVFTRNNVPTFVDLGPAPQILQIVPTDQGDIGRRVLVQGVDKNGNVIYTQDGLNRVTGVFVTLDFPFVNCPSQLNSISGIQKDVTNGPVNFFQVDPNTGNTVQLLSMQPGEQTASYRRYYFSHLPNSCCLNALGPNPNTAPSPLTVTALVKLDLIPVVVDTDYCLIQNLEAIICECQSIRLSEVDNPTANITMSKRAHLEAIGLLNGELAHFLGIDDPAVDFAPFGAARLEHQKIGSML